MTESVVAYYRVSTQRQQASGLGLEAQSEAVEALCRARGWTVTAEFTEAESGKSVRRPQLTAALEECEVTGSRLVIAKLDRLSRNAAFLLHLRDAGVQFMAADMPDACELTVGVLALVAEREGKAISERTRAGLSVKRRRLAVDREALEQQANDLEAKGLAVEAEKLRTAAVVMRLGNPNGAAPLRKAAKGNAASRLQASANADAFAVRLLRRVQRIISEGTTSAAGIARVLNANGVRTPRGGEWHASSVSNLRRRLKL